MATTTGTLIVYDSFKRDIQNGTIDVDGDTFICGLSTSVYVPDRSAHETLANITNEVTGNGYARQTLLGVTLTEPVAGTWRFDSDDPVFTAAGGSIVARWWWIFDDTPTSPADPLCFYGLLDNTPADVTTTDTNTLTIQVNASGYYELSGGET
jgi:hypothetical protein